MKQTMLTKTVITVEVTGFCLVTLFLWLNELLDLPHTLFGSPPTPVNWIESLFETAMLLFLGIYVVSITCFFLESSRAGRQGPLFCRGCKKINIGDEWICFSDYVQSPEHQTGPECLCPGCINDRDRNPSPQTGPVHGRRNGQR